MYAHSKRMILTHVIFLVILALTSCSGTATTNSSNSSSSSASSPTNSNLLGLTGEYKSEYSFCLPGLQDGWTTCAITYFSHNPTDAVIEETYGEVFAVVDGKIFAAENDQGSDGAGTVSDSWNPDQTKRGTTYFTVPTGATIERIFWANDPDFSQAEFVVEVGISANAD